MLRVVRTVAPPPERSPRTYTVPALSGVPGYTNFISVSAIESAKKGAWAIHPIIEVPCITTEFIGVKPAVAFLRTVENDKYNEDGEKKEDDGGAVVVAFPSPPNEVGVHTDIASDISKNDKFDVAAYDPVGTVGITVVDNSKAVNATSHISHFLNDSHLAVVGPENRLLDYFSCKVVV